MEKLIRKYETKLIEQELVAPEGPLMGGRDADLIWNREDSRLRPVMEEVILGLNINSILFARPSEPYFSLINQLIKRLPEGVNALAPQDIESRTFLHDLPVAKELSAPEIISSLKRRKCVIVPDEGVVTFGTVTPEQCFIVYSSVLLSLFVKAFVDHCEDLRTGRQDPELTAMIAEGIRFYKPVLESAFDYRPLMEGPFDTVEQAHQAICEAGKLTVEKGMVDSFFGNISYRLGDTIHITQCGTTLDELEGVIDPCPMDDSLCTGITASSEYKAHKGVYQKTDSRAIIHCHPRFTVIMSMICENKEDCADRELCHIKCKKERRIGNIPVCPGESGTGPKSIGTTLPPYLVNDPIVINYGHGIFARSEKDFNEIYEVILEAEKVCFEEYFKRIG